MRLPAEMIQKPVIAVLLLVCTIYCNAQQATTYTKYSATYSTIVGYELPKKIPVGLSFCSFEVTPTISLSVGNDYSTLYVRILSTASSARSVKGKFEYRYRYHGREYTDQELGHEVFYPIQVGSRRFQVVVQGDAKSVHGIFSDIGGTLMEHGKPVRFSKDANIKNFNIQIVGLDDVGFNGIGSIHQKIEALKREERKKREDDIKLKIQAEVNADRKKQTSAQTATTTKNTGAAPVNHPSENNIPATAPSAATNTDRSALPELAKGTDGKYYRKDASNNYQQISSDAYNAAKYEQSQKKQQETAAAKRVSDQKMLDAELEKLTALNEQGSRDLGFGNKSTGESVSDAANSLTQLFASNREDKEKRQAREAASLEEELYEDKKLAAQGNTEAMLRVGDKYFLVNYRNGWLKPDMASAEKAMEWYKAAAARGNTLAMLKTGRIYRYAPYKDFKQALIWYKKAAERDDLEGIYTVVNLYKEGGNGLKNDPADLAKWEQQLNMYNAASIKEYEKRANNKDVGAMLKLANIYSSGYENLAVHEQSYIRLSQKHHLNRFYSVKDYSKALKWYGEITKSQTMTEEKSYASQALAFMQKKGLGTTSGDETYKQLIKKTKNDKEALHILRQGNEYHQKDQYRDALKKYIKAAEMGNVYAMRNIGTYHLYGWSVNKDRNKAFSWYLKAAEAGEHYDSGYYMYLLYVEEPGINHSDDLLITTWLIASAEKGNPDAMRVVSKLYETGAGFSKDEKKAEEWKKKAEEREKELKEAAKD